MPNDNPIQYFVPHQLLIISDKSEQELQALVTNNNQGAESGNDETMAAAPITPQRLIFRQLAETLPPASLTPGADGGIAAAPPPVAAPPAVPAPPPATVTASRERLFHLELPDATDDEFVGIRTQLRNSVPGLLEFPDPFIWSSAVPVPFPANCAVGDTHPNTIPGGGPATLPKSQSLEFASLKIGEIAALADSAASGTVTPHVIILDTIPQVEMPDGSIKYFHQLTQNEVQTLFPPVTGTVSDNTILHQLWSELGTGKFKVIPTALPNAIKDAQMGCHPYQLSSHGLFIASVIRTLAPSAKITLVQGLNRYGSGSVSYFVDTVNKYFVSKSEEQTEGLIDPKQPTIINFSLTFAIPLPGKSGFIAGFKEQLETNLNRCLGPLLPDGGSQIRNIIIAAATGNEGAEPHEPRMPASLLDVLDIEAIDVDGNRAPYSNEGDRNQPDEIFGAFGGPLKGAFVDPYPIKDESANMLTTAVNNRGIATWIGTSFATAVATGALAELCSTGISTTQAVNLLRQHRSVLNALPVETPDTMPSE